jgi:hypothetical protein
VKSLLGLIPALLLTGCVQSLGQRPTAQTTTPKANEPTQHASPVIQSPRTTDLISSQVGSDRQGRRQIACRYSVSASETRTLIFFFRDRAANASSGMHPIPQGSGEFVDHVVNSCPSDWRTADEFRTARLPTTSTSATILAIPSRQTFVLSDFESVLAQIDREVRNSRLSPSTAVVEVNRIYGTAIRKFAADYSAAVDSALRNPSVRDASTYQQTLANYDREYTQPGKAAAKLVGSLLRSMLDLHLAKDSEHVLVGFQSTFASAEVRFNQGVTSAREAGLKKSADAAASLAASKTSAELLSRLRSVTVDVRTATNASGFNSSRGSQTYLLAARDEADPIMSEVVRRLEDELRRIDGRSLQALNAWRSRSLLPAIRALDEFLQVANERYVSGLGIAAASETYVRQQHSSWDSVAGASPRNPVRGHFNRLMELAKRAGTGQVAFPSDLARAAEFTDPDRGSRVSSDQRRYVIYGTPAEIAAFVMGKSAGDAVSGVFRSSNNMASMVSEITANLTRSRRAFWDCYKTKCKELASRRSDLSTWLFARDQVQFVNEGGQGGLGGQFASLLQSLPSATTGVVLPAAGITHYHCRLDFIRAMPQAGGGLGRASADAMVAAIQGPRFADYLQCRDEIEYLLNVPG